MSDQGSSLEVMKMDFNGNRWSLLECTSRSLKGERMDVYKLKKFRVTVLIDDEGVQITGLMLDDYVDVVSVGLRDFSDTITNSVFNFQSYLSSELPAKSITISESFSTFFDLIDKLSHYYDKAYIEAYDRFTISVPLSKDYHLMFHVQDDSWYAECLNLKKITRGIPVETFHDIPDELRGYLRNTLVLCG